MAEVGWWDVKPTEDGKRIALIPRGPGYEDPRESERGLIELTPTAALEVGGLLLRTAQMMRKDFATEK